MKRKNSVLVLLAISYWLLAVGTAEAQFGKNNVRYNQLDKFYASYRFDVWHNLDVSDPLQKEYLEMVVANLENARDWMSGNQIYGHTIEKRIPILLYNTHSEMESSNLVGGFLPEGVGAFVEWERRRMVLKADFSKPLGRAVGVHELAHEFQIDILSPGIIDKVMNNRRPLWFHEGGAEFIAGLYEPHTRSDIRRDNQIIASSDRHFIPTWEALARGQVNPYSDGAMVFEFLEEKFKAGVAFQVQGFKLSRIGLGELIYDLTKGELGNPDANSEKFNQAITRFWMDKYGNKTGDIQRPYEENDNFNGRSVMPWGHSAPMSSPVRSPDGKQIAAFTVLKYGVSLSRYEIPGEKVYVSKEERVKQENKSKAFGPNGFGIVNLTPQLPPSPWEYLIAQGLETAPFFSGFDLSWSHDGKKIAFFARINRDHALVIIDSVNGKILRKMELPFDQAFSPSFNVDDHWVYFSAAENVERNIYAVYVGDPTVQQIIKVTNDERFDTAPAVSPDGSKVVYVGSDGDFQHLFLYYVKENRIEQLTFGKFNDAWPNWSDDGSTIVYASDEADDVWNLYTFSLDARIVSQWTKLLWGVKMPIFAKETLNTVYYVSPGEDTQSGGIYDKMFEAKLKKPIREYTVRDSGAAGEYVFIPVRDLFKFELDDNQLLNPTPVPEKWDCGGGQIAFGVSTYWGAFGQSYARCSNLLETKQHSAIFLSRGDFRILGYSYSNREKRTGWLWGGHQYQMPYYYQFYDVVNRYPNQFLLNNSWITESAFDLHTEYPLNKFNRLELFSSLRNRSFSLFGYEVGDLNEGVFKDDPRFTDKDIQVYRFLRNSAGSNLAFGAAYVRDTVICSPSVGLSGICAPFHGNALRTQLEFAPPLGEEFQGYTSVNVAARTYRHLGLNSLFAGRAELMATSRANGDFMLLCGAERLRGCEYGSIIGNQIGYVSAELRFPIPGTYLLYQGVRGLFFADAAYAKFSDERFSSQKLKTYGFGAQYVIPFVGLPAQSIWRRDNGKWKPSFYITIGW